MKIDNFGEMKRDQRKMQARTRERADWEERKECDFIRKG